MSTAKELIGQQVVLKVTLDHYRWPRKKTEILPGHFAIVVFNLLSIVKGEVPDDFFVGTGYEIIVTGNTMPLLTKKAPYILTGTLRRDKRYGLQYEVNEIHLDYDLSKEKDQRAFFSFFMSAERIDQLFVSIKDPLKALQNKDLSELQKAKGVGPFMALKMCQKFEECKGNSRAYVELQKLGLTKSAIDKLVAHYRSADVAIDKIQNNPYILIKEVRGYGWERADEIAARQGFTSGCKERVMAYAQYYLEKQADDNGNSWVSIDDLITNIYNMCVPATKTDIANWLREDMAGQTDFREYIKNIANPALDCEKPTFYYEKDQRRVGLYSLRILEKSIALEIKRLQQAKCETEFDRDVCEKIIKETEKEVGYQYTEEQRQAMWNILNENVSLLTASAGCGKSSTLKPLVKIFKHYHLKVEQTALSGRASSLLSEITDVEGKTIHRLLAYMPEQEKFAHSERCPLKADVIVLDEASMVGEELFLSLIKAIKDGAKLILLGDTKQLPPISVGNILSDFIRSSYVTNNILTKIHRQAAQSGIVTQSLVVASGHSILKNDFIGEEIRGDLKDFKVISCYDVNLVQFNIIKEFKKLYLEQQIPASDIQIVVPTRTKGNTSCRALNDIIQNIVNGSTKAKSVQVHIKEKGTEYDVTFKVGDRVLVNHNNYHAIDCEGKEQAIFNGNIGYIRDLSEDVMIINFPEQGDVMIGKDDWWNLSLAYAITVHKIQGSQAPYVIVGLDYSSYALLSRELVYTALTRAQKYCALVTQPKALNMAVKTSSIRLKQTWLKDDLLDLKIDEEVGGAE